MWVNNGRYFLLNVSRRNKREKMIIKKNRHKGEEREREREALLIVRMISFNWYKQFNFWIIPTLFPIKSKIASDLLHNKTESKLFNCFHRWMRWWLANFRQLLLQIRNEVDIPPTLYRHIFFVDKLDTKQNGN